MMDFLVRNRKFNQTSGVGLVARVPQIRTFGCPGFASCFWTLTRDSTFVNKLGQPFKGGKIAERKLKPLLQRLGLRKRGLHAFRGANATLLDRLNVPMKVRQDRLGHTDPRVTMKHYTGAVGGDDRKAAEELGKILCPIVSNDEKGRLSRSRAALALEQLRSTQNL
jgi:hypothetical protein